jgi:hypothetical protein
MAGRETEVERWKIGACNMRLSDAERRTGSDRGRHGIVPTRNDFA